jgi:hypothetical protein
MFLASCNAKLKAIRNTVVKRLHLLYRMVQTGQKAFTRLLWENAVLGIHGENKPLSIRDLKGLESHAPSHCSQPQLADNMRIITAFRDSF